MYPLLLGFSFKDVTTGVTTMSRVEVPLPIFPVELISAKNIGCFLAKVEMDAERIFGSYRTKEHDACMAAKRPNNGHLNRVFEQMGVPYAPRLLLSTDAFEAATKKWKVGVSRKTTVKKAKVAPMKVARQRR
jgi:hypothetical protein